MRLNKKTGLLLSALLLAGFNSQAHAGRVQNLHEAQIDAIFSQKSFGTNTIDIRFNPSRTLYNSAWLIEDFPYGSYRSADDLGELTRASGLANSLTVPMFYIDGYTERGHPSPTIGLGWIGDNGFSLLTSVQADLALKPETHLPCSPEETAQGCGYWIDPAITQADIEANYWRSAHIMAHELGHNLGLWHTSDISDLMYPSVAPLGYPAPYSLTDAEVATILRSPFVQMDANGQRFISITPFSVLAPLPPAAVPLPAAWWMFASGAGLLGWLARGKSSVAA